MKEFLKNLWGSSLRERQRILLLLPLLVGICLLFGWLGKPRFERSLTLYSDALFQKEQPAIAVSAPTSSPEQNGTPSAVAPSLTSKPTAPALLFPFDPNTLDRDGFVRLGFSEKQAQGILNYRAAGAVFRRPADFARCYVVSDKKFAELEPWIRIPKEVSIEREQRAETLPVAQVLQDSAVAQSAWKQRASEESSPLELNGADSAALVRIRGIGALTAGRILRYRKRLGGFASETQLREVTGVTEENYQLIIQQISVDCRKIQKIDVNFATPERLAQHPYLPPRVVDGILKNRQLKGGWNSIQEMTEQHILSEEQAARLTPYLDFGPLESSETEF